MKNLVSKIVKNPSTTISGVAVAVLVILLALGKISQETFSAALGACVAAGLIVAGDGKTE